LCSRDIIDLMNDSVSLWLVSFCWTKSLLCNDAFYQGFSYFQNLHFRAVFLEDYAQIPSKSNRIPCIRPNDMIFRQDAQLSKHHPSGRRELSIRTFLCVEKLRTAPGCIRLDVSGTRPDTFQCSTRKSISFQNTDMGRQLQPSERCVFPFGRYPW
jgi:hypothetical protein